MKMYKLFTICFVMITSLLQAQDYFPANGEWEERDASQFKINKERLSRAVDFAEGNEYTGSRDLRQAILKGFEQEPFHEISGPTKKRGGPAGMIIKDGYVISSWGDTQRVDMTFSVTKSFLSTTGLLALQEGLIANAGEKVAQYVWDGTFDGEHNSKVTWQHLLDQTSDWSGNLWGGYDWADRPPSTGGLDDWRNRQLNEPGTVFEYNDVRVNLLAYSLLQVWRQPLPKVLKERIMDPIGASPTWRWFGYENAWVDIDGLKMQSVTGGGHSGGGLFINTEDMARFGLLFARNGKWEGEQLLSEELIEEAIQASPANENYGYMWWLNQKGSRHWEGLPEHIFYAAGFGGNFIIIDREQDLVIVTRWLEPSKIAEFTKLVYEAL
ncbi:serine hydrolase [Antarcticibacterium flavum]|uniref:Serine hydrolase n=1 Tax=Antarcticibacterium flavum TaxID=2058175 RepID=A0A5B7X8Y6_9FLAO|nr:MULTISPECIES: serine hydrolase [Antarcticibacterium]MCM4160371.1 serine hydrolase [Antarcticibacterium sp. W02-3]QCY71252.1 serine hydrolase [Antarcticibacterium flavum]